MTSQPPVSAHHGAPDPEHALALQRVSQRLLQLAPQQRQAFCQALRDKGIALTDLPIVAGERSEQAPLAPAQQRLWFLDQLEGPNPAYNICVALRLQGPLQAEALKTGFQSLLMRHGALRTAILTQDGTAVQHVAETLAVPWETQDLTALTPLQQTSEIERIGQAMANIRFDLARPPLMRLYLARTAAQDHLLWLTVHHIVADGWSMDVLVKELGALYEAHLSGRQAALPALPISHADCAVWHQEVMAPADAVANQLAYWKDRLGEAHPILSLPSDRPRPARQSLRGGVHCRELPAPSSHALKSLCRREAKTSFALMLAAFQILLWKHSGQSDIRVGTPIANRDRVETQGLVGLFANTLVLRAELEGHQRFVDLLATASLSIAEAQAHQDLPFEKLVDALQVPRVLSHAPLFQAMLIVNTAPAPLHLSGLTVEPVPTPRETAKFDLTLEVTEHEDGGVMLDFVYAKDLFDATTIDRLACRFEHVLQGIAAAPQTRLDQLPLLGSGEWHQVVRGWNGTATHYPQEAWIHELIERQARATPHGPALYVAEEVLSYRRLNERSNQLAHWLRDHGVREDSVVGVCMERSVEMVVALLGVMKAGAAYLPLDPAYPQDRLDHMAGDAELRLLLSRSGTPRQPRVPGLHTVALDQQWEDIAMQPIHAPVTRVQGQHLAYVIYTSGSTGRPKGVAVPHQGLLNRLQWMQAAYRLERGDRVLQKTPFSFDVSVWEFFWPLMTGAALVMAPPGAHRDSEQLIQLIRQRGVTTLHFVPSMLRAFLDDPHSGECDSITRVICSGEALPFDLQQRFFATLDAPLYNLYGPTEASIDVSHWTCRRETEEATVPIGHPIANTTLYVLDGGLQPAPVGVAGELHIGGIGLARGYLGQPALTAEKFIPDPFSIAEGARLYKTGDLARWRTDGSIEYLGRLDHQVKIRGFRIELGEIEARLLAHPGVAAAAVVAREDRPGDKRLVAYWVAKPASAPDDDELRGFLALALPEHMLPSAFVPLPALPLSPNGKLDRKQLPALATQPAREAPLAPRNEAERLLAEVWQDVLGLPQVGVQDNFFRLGGDSILSLQVIARARQRGLRLTPKQMFEHQTIAQAAAVAEALASPAASHQIAEGELLPLTPIQRWFFETGFKTPAHWNQALVLRLNERLPSHVVAQALQAVVAHHGALRLRFEQQTEGHWVQRTSKHDADAMRLEQIDLGALPEEALAAAIEDHGTGLQGRLDPARGLVLRAALFECGSLRPQRLLIAAHHLVIDGVSWRVLVDDLATACTQLHQAEPLSAPSTSYGAWAHHLARHARSQAVLAELPQWLEACAPLPFGDAQAGTLAQSRRVRVRLDRERTQRLLREAPARVRARVDDVLLAVLAQTLCEWKNVPALLVELEGHGREDLFDEVDLSRTIGWFTTRFPVRLQPEGDSPVEVLKAVKEQLRAVPGKGLGHGLLRYLADDATRARLAGLPTPQVCFNYLGQFDQTFRSGGLFSLAAETPGATRRPDERRTQLMDVDAQVVDGVLSVDWQVDHQLCSGAELATVVQQFMHRLETTVDALMSTTAATTPSDFPLAGLSRREIDALPLAWDQVEDLYPLTPMQQGLLLHTLLQPGTGTYLMQERYVLDGTVDAQVFIQAWEAVVQRHPALRSAFVSRADAGPLQVVYQALDGVARSLDWREFDPEAQQRELESLLHRERSCLDPAQAPLARFHLIRLADEQHLFVLSCHHLLLDAWSFSLAVGDFIACYQALLQGSGPPLPAAAPYARFVSWLAQQDLAVSRAHWRGLLSGFDERTPLPLKRASAAVAADPIDQRLLLDVDETQKLHAAVQAHGLTLNTLAQAAWAWLLAVFSGRNDVVFGTTVAGRPPELPGVEQTVGLFINTLPLRARLSPAQPVLDWLRALQSQAVDARQHQHLPLWDIQSCSDLGAGESLFDSLLVFENTPVDPTLGAASLPFRFQRVGGRAHTHYPVTLAVSPGQRLRIELSHDPLRIDAGTAARMLALYKTALFALAEGRTQALGALSLQKEPVRPASAGIEMASTKTIPQQLVDSCARHANRVALVLDGLTMDYQNLAARVDRVAGKLVAHGLRPEERVGLCFERSLEMVIALLAVMRAGGAYVVLDPVLPAERLATQCADAGVAVVLMHRATHALAQRVAAKAARMDVDAALAEPDAAGLQHPCPWSLPGQLAYLLFTSGSTGRPKAVAVSHAALAAHALAMRNALALTPDDRVLQFNTLAFDASIDQLLPPLLAGATVVLRGPAVWDSTELHHRLVRDGITVADFPTSYWLQTLREWPAGQGRSCASLRLVCVGGEALPADAMVNWHAAGFPQARLLNAYGPTEATVTATLHACGGNDMRGGAEEQVMPIGKAVEGRELQVLDTLLQPVPEGVTGELYIGGELLARGYHERPALTAERFVPDPFGPPGSRLYRTGDRVQWRPDGSLAYRGRVDEQLKLRGFRIEPGEIETQLREQPGVQEAAVVLREDRPGDKRLVAYLTGHLVPAAEALRDALASRLPDYMLPGAFVVLPALPFTPSGKLDRAALPAPALEVRDGSPAARNDTERCIAAVWAELLGHSAFGVTDNFFRLGGDSIIALQVVSRLRRAGLGVSPKDLFQHPTIERLAWVAQAKDASAPGQDEVSAGGSVPLTPIQRWLLSQPLSRPQHWNQSLLLQARERLDAAALEAALQSLVLHHDALRLCFTQAADGHWQQAYHEPEGHKKALLQRLAIAPTELPGVCSRIQASLDLAHAPLAAALMQLPDGSQRLLLVVHHLVVDGVSWRVLLEDLSTAYQQAAAGSMPSLPPRSSAYQAWARQLVEWAQSPALREELRYWQQALKPVCFPARSGSHRPTIGEALSVAVQLSEHDTRLLLTEVHAAYRTQVNDLLLCALGDALARFAGESHALVELEGHGRDELPGTTSVLDLSRTVGWFTSRHPVCLPAIKNLQALKEVKEQLRQVPNKGLGWGMLEFLAPPELQAAARALPQPCVSFNYLGQLDSVERASLFTLAEESAGAGVAPDNPRSHWIEIDGAVREGKLGFSWRFSPELHSPHEIKALAEAHLATLRRLIDHCLQAEGGATPSDFPLAGLTQPELDALPTALIEDIYPLSPMQQGMLFHSVCQPQNDVYVNQLHGRLTGPFDVPAFDQAWQQALAQHEALRTSFHWQREGEPLQIVWHQARLQVDLLDWRQSDADTCAQTLQTLLSDDQRLGFDLAKAPAMRLHVVLGPQAQTDIVWTCHHLLLDGWSSARLVDEVLARYQALQQGRAFEPRQVRPYRDYIAWRLDTSAAEAERHWREALTGLSAPLLVASGTSDAAARLSAYAEQRSELSESQTQGLLRAAQDAGLTVSAVVQAAWALLLSRYSGRRDVVFGVTVAGRPVDLPVAQETLGLFINTLPMFCRLTPGQSFEALARRVSECHQSALPFEATPLADIQRWTFGGGQPLFDTLVVFENYPIAATAQTDRGLAGIEVMSRQDRTSYPLTLNVLPGRCLQLELSHQRSVLSDEKVERMSAQLRQLLLAFAQAPQASIGNLPVLTAVENRRLDAWNETGMGEEVPSHLYTLFEKQVQSTPDAIAVRCGEVSLSYRELHQRAEAAGAALIELGVGADQVVALCDGRGPDLLTMLLAVFKAGGAYLPLDPGHPAQRLQQILALSNTQWVLSGKHAGSELEAALAGLPSARRLTLAELLLRRPGANGWRPDLDGPAAGHALAYVIYTSGSTGTPKGAMVERHGLLNNLLQKHVQLGLKAGDVVAQTAPATFDISVWQFLSGLLCGATIEIVADEVVRDPAALLDVLVERGITVLEAVPSLIHAVLVEAQPEKLPLRWLLPTGEALPPALANQWLARHPDVPLLNVYGPAECADDVSLQVIRSSLPEDCIHTPIGRPVANLRLHVLDADLQRVPAGTAGELCIAGLGVGRGYLGDPARTAEAFVPDPCSPVPGARLYRTGDVARQRDDGVFEYLGRRDQQVKVRGHRIELGEVESCLSRLDGVEQAVCAVREMASGQSALVAYLTGDGLDAAVLNARLAKLLPPYMLPSVIAVLPSLPLNANGKIDRQALPAIDGAWLAESGPVYSSPATAMEALLANVWSEVLGVDRVGVNDNFFALGGHSLLAVRAMQKARQLLQRALPLTLIFQTPTIAGMAAELARQAHHSSPLIELRRGANRLPLFCVHPAGGHVASYLPLVNRLPAGQPVYGLQSRSLSDSCWRDESIAAMARDYVSVICEQQPEGPYQLLGWSMGGTIAMAMAAELERQGREVAWVVLLDTVHPRQGESAVRSDHAAECLDYLEGLSRDALNNHALLALREELRTLAPDAQLASVVDWGLAQGLLPQDTNADEVRLRLQSRHDSFRLMREHRPVPVHASVHLWQAQATVRESSAEELSWAPYARNLSVSVVPGDHLQIVRSPGVVQDLVGLLHQSTAAHAVRKY